MKCEELIFFIDNLNISNINITIILQYSIVYLALRLINLSLYVSRIFQYMRLFFYFFTTCSTFKTLNLTYLIGHTFLINVGNHWRNWKKKMR